MIDSLSFRVELPPDWHRSGGPHPADVFLLAERRAADRVPGTITGSLPERHEGSLDELAGVQLRRLSSAGHDVLLLDRKSIDDPVAPAVVQRIELRTPRGQRLAQTQALLSMPAVDRQGGRLTAVLVCTCEREAAAEVMAEFEQVVASFSIVPAEQESQ